MLDYAKYNQQQPADDSGNLIDWQQTDDNRSSTVRNAQAGDSVTGSQNDDDAQESTLDEFRLGNGTELENAPPAAPGTSKSFVVPYLELICSQSEEEEEEEETEVDYGSEENEEGEPQPEQQHPGQGNAGDRPGNTTGGEQDRARRLAEFEASFRAALTRTDRQIEDAARATTSATNALGRSQAESLNLDQTIGINRLALERARELNRQDLITRHETEDRRLTRLSEGSDTRERTLIENVPTRERDLRAYRAVYLISSGTDENIRQGERQLLQVVRDNPSLQLAEEFRNLVLRGYSEMAAARTVRGLPTWTSNLNVNDLTAPARATPPGDAQPAGGAQPGNDAGAPQRTPAQLLQTASETYFQNGFERARPLFQQAYQAAEGLERTQERGRLEAFIQTLRQDATIAQRQHANQNVDALMEDRTDAFEREQTAVRRAQAATNERISIGVNIAFARIASGDPARLTEGRADLLQLIEQNPALQFDNQFRQSRQNAFLAHEERREQLAAAPPAQAQDNPPPNNQGGNTANNTNPRFAELDLSRNYGVREIDNEEQGGMYASDIATNVALGALGLGMAISTFLQIRNRIIAARTTREAVRAAHEVRPIEGLGNNPTIERETAPGGERARFEVRGEARDGRVVLQRTGASQDNLRSIQPEGTFRPSHGEYSIYTPFEVGGRRYYADREGTAYEYSRGRLVETAQSRQFVVVPFSQVEATMRAAQAGQGPGNGRQPADRAAVERETRDFVRSTTDAFSNNNTSARRLEQLNRSLNRLARLPHADRQAAMEQVVRELRTRGIEATITNPTTTGANGMPELRLDLTMPGTRSRLIISTNGPTRVEQLNSDGSVRRTYQEPARAADELTRMERASARAARTGGGADGGGGTGSGGTTGTPDQGPRPTDQGTRPTDQGTSGATDSTTNSGTNTRETEARAVENRFMDLLRQQAEQLNPGRRPGSLSPAEINVAMQLLNSRLNAGGGNETVEVAGQRLTAQEARDLAAAGTRLATEYSAGTASGAPTSAQATVERVRTHMSTAAPATEGALPVWESGNAALSELSRGRTVIEQTASGLDVRRYGTAGESAGDRVPSEREIEQIVRERIREMESDFERRERDRDSRPITAEERATLETLRAAERTGAREGWGGVRAAAEPLFSRLRSRAGAAIGIGIIVSAALGWYIRTQNNGVRPRGLESTQIPGC